MYLECSKDKILDAITRIEKTTNKNAALPVLSCALLVVSGKSLTVKATNLEVGVEITLPVKVTSEGVVAVPSQLLQQTLNAVKSNKPISISEEGGLLVITSENSKTSLKTLSFEEFPLIPRIDEVLVHTKIKVKDFITGIKSVIFSASLSSIKPELGSVYVYHKDNDLVFAATDNFRLAEKKVSLRVDHQFPSLLIPYKNCIEIIRILEGADGEVVIDVNKNSINLTTESVFITSRLVDALFPDYEQIIPKESVTSVSALKQDVVDAIRSLTVFSDKFNQISFTIHKADHKITLRAKNNDLGEGESTIKGKVTGEDVVISFNQRYILDGLQSITDESLIFSFSGPHRPLLIENAGHKNFRYLVMPMNR